jgi:succinate dehydrogenase / fumarate reductase, membrane anchor subunit
MRTSLGMVRGLGSAKNGTEHFWAQRVTAVALVPLAVWFMASLVALSAADHAALVGFLKAPVPLITMLLFLATGFYHLRLGVQVVIEDYVKDEGVKLAMLLGNTFFCVAVGVSALVATLKISFGA